MEICELKKRANRYRVKTLEIIKSANAGHTGGDLSCIDILTVLYNDVLNISPEKIKDPDRDRYIQSKGHAAEALYAVLSELDYIPADWVKQVGGYLSPATGHPTNNLPGVEQNTGALGHGLSVSVGIALAAKLDGKKYRVFTLVGDGELAEGSNWEACMAAANFKLDNLVVIVDRNRLQISGSTEDVMALEPLKLKFEAFGFAVHEVDGNDIAALKDIFSAVPFETGKPSLILANTIKGKGISYMENQLKWHHRVPTEEQYSQAMDELRQEKEELV